MDLNFEDVWELLGENEPEVLWSELQVQALLSVGSEGLTMFFTNKRILVAHGVKYGSGSMAASSFLGGMGGIVRSLRRQKKPDVKPEDEGFKPGRILASDKDNFFIPYREVVEVVVTEPDDPSGLTGISLLTERDKLRLTSKVSVLGVMDSFRRGLGEKVRVQKSRKLPHA